MPLDLDIRPFKNREAAANDPVQTYFYEIGQIPLLTVEEELFLGQKIEKGKRLQAIELKWFHQYQRPLLATDIPVAILENLVRAFDFINLIQQKAGRLPLNNSMGISSIVGTMGKVDKESRKQLVRIVANATGETESDIDVYFSNLIVDTSLLPKKVWESISDIITLERLKDIPANGHLANLIQSHEYGIRVHIDNVRQEAKEARRKLIESNLRLVVSIARKHTDQEVPLLDIIQEGNLGLIKAVDKFDHKLGYKFCTYATWWIYQAITRSIINQSRMIHIPARTAASVHKLARIKQGLTQALEREPTSLEIIQEMDVSLQKFQEIYGTTQPLLSLESPVGEDGNSLLIDFIEDKSAPSPPDVASKQMLKEDISATLSTLTLREQKVIRLRFGLGDGRCRTLEEIGTELRISREWVRQIETKALNRLRHHSRKRKLKDYY